jgi:hypothetical protein
MKNRTKRKVITVTIYKLRPFVLDDIHHDGSVLAYNI